MLNPITPIEKLTRKELKVYLAVLKDSKLWNQQLKLAVKAGKISVNKEIEKVESLLNEGSR